MVALYLSLAIAGSIVVAFSCTRFTRGTAWLLGGLLLLQLLLSATWVTSDFFSGEGFNASVLYHLRSEAAGVAIAEYAGILALTVLLIIGTFLSVWILLRYLGSKAGSNNSAQAWLLLLAMFGTVTLHPTVNGFLAMFNRGFYGETSVADTAGEDFDAFYSAPQFTSGDGNRMNLVLLYAESFEQTYFDEALFPGLVTELRAFEDEVVRFSDIQGFPGTGFTIGGMVASQCGLPLITHGHPNTMRGMDRFLPGAVCIGDILADQGYALHYMGGAETAFAGTEKFLRSHGFTSITGRKQLEPLLEDPDYVSGWGVYDDFLMEKMLERYDALSASGTPFALVALTMDTHHPRGHASKSCAGMAYGDGSNSMLNAVKCSDAILAQTINHIRSSKWSENTLLVVASDHLALPNRARQLLKQGRRRNLLWIFPPDGEARTVAKPGATIDTAPAILHFLGHDVSQFALGNNLVVGEPSIVETLGNSHWQARAWRDEFASFWEMPEAFETITLGPEAMGVTIDGRELQGPALVVFSGTEIGHLKFHLDTKETLLPEVRAAAGDTVLLWFDVCAKVRAMDLALPVDGACLFIGPLGSTRAVVQQVQDVYTLRVSDLSEISDRFGSDQLLSHRYANLDAAIAHGSPELRKYEFGLDAVPADFNLAVRSSGGLRGRSSVTRAGVSTWVRRGLHLFAISEREAPRLLARFDPCSGQVQGSIAAAIAAAPASAQPLGHVLLAHDSAVCDGTLDALFEGLPLTRWRELGLRQPYVAFMPSGNTGASIEVLADRELALEVTFLASPKSSSVDVAGLPPAGQ